MSAPGTVLLVLHRGARAGTEFHALWLAQGLRKRGWSVALAVSEDGPILDLFRDAGVSVHRVPRRRGTDLIYIASLARLAARLGADVIHAHSGRLPMLAARLAGVPARIETRHGLGAPEESVSPRLARAEARRCRMAQLTITVSRVDRERLIAGGLDPERIRCIPNGIPSTTVRRSAATAGALRLGFLGRLTEQKDPLFLIPLAGALDRRLPGRWSLAIAGDGPLRARLEAGLRSPNARFLGEIPGPASLFKQIDLLCVPSAWEGQPLGVLEAMAAGVLIAARDIPTLKELLGGPPEAGMVLPNDPTAWVEEIASLATDLARQEMLRDNARARVLGEHGLDRMIERIESAYRDALAAAGRG
jgi:glycosyltransferase involved in cell wall biosynthesis